MIANGYATSFSVQAAEARPRPMASGPELVSSGGFRVDAARMAGLLRQHQLLDPADFLLPLMRCACASDATRMEVSRCSGGIEIRFDGIPFEARELKDPLSPMLEDPIGCGRGRHLAYALLALERMGIEAVSVTSGGPSGQASVALSRPGIESRAIGINRGEGTLLRVLWPRLSSWWSGSSALARLRAAYGLSRTALLLDGKRVPAAPVRPGNGWFDFERVAWRGLFRFLPEGTYSRVHLYCLGASVETLERKLPGAPVEALLGGDGLCLDLSQAHAVQDAEFYRGLDVVSEEAGKRRAPVTLGSWFGC